MGKKRTRPDMKWDGNENIKPGDRARYLQHALRNWDLERVNLGDINAVRERVRWYFDNCIADDVKPSVAGLCNALKISQHTFVQWLNGDYRGVAHQEMAQNVIDIMREIHETMMQEGTINPVVGIFLSKVHFGYIEKQELTVTPGPDLLGERVPLAQLRDKYAESVEVDYKVREELPPSTE